MQILGDPDEAKQFREQESVALNQSEVESDRENENQEVEVRKIVLFVLYFQKKIALC